MEKPTVVEIKGRRFFVGEGYTEYQVDNFVMGSRVELAIQALAEKDYQKVEVLLNDMRREIVIAAQKNIPVLHLAPDNTK